MKGIHRGVARRSAWVAMQFRTQVLILLVPLGLLAVTGDSRLLLSLALETLKLSTKQ